MKRFVISRTPLRVSLIGGGSDLSDYYERAGYGEVISMSIDKYIYITANNRQDKKIRVGYSKTELKDVIDDVDHELVREALLYLGETAGLEITSISDVTAHGTGLGSSSAYTVGVLNAVSCLRNKRISKFNLANDACKIEIERCGHPIGKQDQFATSFGGLNRIKFQNNQVIVSPVNVETENLDKLSKRLLLFDTSIKRRASKILETQKKSYEQNKLESTKLLVDLVPTMEHAIINDIDLVGDILNESWNIKRSITDNISNNKIDDLYKIGIENGATGGKLCGAGGGGYLLFYAKEENHEKLRKSLSNLTELNFSIDTEGTTII
jgi:D-glycero-alpha-D-manno-heptose-7-phosphate kinase